MNFALEWPACQRNCVVRQVHILAVKMGCIQCNCLRNQGRSGRAKCRSGPAIRRPGSVPDDRFAAPCHGINCVKRAAIFHSLSLGISPAADPCISRGRRNDFSRAARPSEPGRALASAVTCAESETAGGWSPGVGIASGTAEVVAEKLTKGGPSVEERPFRAA